MINIRLFPTLTLSRQWGQESVRADFKCIYLKNSYSSTVLNSKISRLFLEIHCQYGQDKWLKKYPRLYLLRHPCMTILYSLLDLWISLIRSQKLLDPS